MLSIALTTLLSADSAMIKEKLMTKFPNLGKVTVQQAHVGELYEVRTQGGIIYTDGEVWVMGNVFDFDGNNLTMQKADKLGMAAGVDPALLEKLDLSKALKIGNGKHQVVLITDPECPWCRQAEEMLKGGDITQYVFLAPLEKVQTREGEKDFHTKARSLALNILCSDIKDQERVYKETFEGKFDALKNLKSCDVGIAKLNTVEKYIEELVPSTRPILIVDGKIILGADPVIRELIK